MTETTTTNPRPAGTTAIGFKDEHIGDDGRIYGPIFWITETELVPIIEVTYDNDPTTTHPGWQGRGHVNAQARKLGLEVIEL